MAKLYVLWTNSSYITLEKMVAMYTVNSLKYGWWDEVTLIIWGETTKSVAEDERYAKIIKKMIDKGVKVSACKACADQLNATAKLEELGVEVIYWGEKLTKLIKEGEKLITI
ncbi:conserved hypothetical protein [Thermosulfidibacter takaii ABI70S6]|uniref:Uncharacterized protein n=1 Tax=Thermosulfidibacter takaii (strain DSM 17441 / JCM 13301 / NBRC 103674 / ABI70S6) TaxID=1298851 RepID=A0A0S3QRA5_THET7|nr:DsrE family protein [Thermosulfidibacter takaii]BAT70868.1 conserved hypothetical protein [Thermosulfidibacter takaii ABI70S6]